MRVADDGALIYANPASEPLLDALEADRRPNPSRLTGSSGLQTADGPVEVRVGAAHLRAAPGAADRSRVHERLRHGCHGRSGRITKFPDQNPNPVFRISMDGVLVYVNPAAEGLIDGIGGTIGEPLPAAAARRELAGRGARQGATADGPRPELADATSRSSPSTSRSSGSSTSTARTSRPQRQLEAPTARTSGCCSTSCPSRSPTGCGGEALIADRFEDVSLLFADIVGFTELSSAMDADRARLVAQRGLQRVRRAGRRERAREGQDDRRRLHGRRRHADLAAGPPRAAGAAGARHRATRSADIEAARTARHRVPRSASTAGPSSPASSGSGSSSTTSGATR